MLEGGEVILLDGPMGAGKTTFTRGLAEGLGVHNPRQVRSPTFALCVQHPGPIELVHVDLYRIESGGSVGYAAFEALGLEFDELGGPGRVLVVEWGERWLEPPDDHVAIRFVRVAESPELRRLVVTATGETSRDAVRRWYEAAAS